MPHLSPEQQEEAQRTLAPAIKDMLWHCALSQAQRMKSKGKRRKFLEHEAGRLGLTEDQRERPV